MVLTKCSNGRLWLQGDIQSPEIDFRFTPNNGHSGAHAGLPVVTPSRHSDNPALCGSSLPERRRTLFKLTAQIGRSQFSRKLVFRFVGVFFVVGGLSVIRPICFARLINLGRIRSIPRLVV